MHKSAKEKISDIIQSLIIQKDNLGVTASVEVTLLIRHLLVPRASLMGHQGR